MTRDLSKAAFIRKCERNGIRHDHFGYYNIGRGVLVFAGNAGLRWRDRLAYLLREKYRIEEEKHG